MKTVPNLPPAALSRPRERGAALITVMLISMLLLLAGGALIMVTSMSAANAADATAESQAYYAAESGLQASLGVLRGNAAPNPLINTLSASAAENKITFRYALTADKSNKTSDTHPPRLSRWLNYDSTYTDRVLLSDNYTPLSGMAYAVEGITDPDSSDVITFSTSGAFDNNSSSKSFPTASSDFTLAYTPVSSTAVSTGGSTGSSNLGSFTVTSSSGGNWSDTLTSEPFSLTITQTSPWASSAVIKCTISGVVARASGTVTSALVLTFPSQTYKLDGVTYTLPALTAPLPLGSSGAFPVTILAPEPKRLLIKVKGYGPHNAVKKMQMLVSRSSFDYTAAGAITLRSHDDGTTQMTYTVGNSSQFTYSGFDNSGGAAIPAFTVTHNNDLTLVNTAISGSPGQIVGVPAGRLANITDLSSFLQTTTGTNGALNTLDVLRGIARNQRWPSDCTGTADQCDRYFGPGEAAPSDLGASQPNGLLTFVDGDLDVQSSTNGAGLLIVTGTLTMHGSARFNGLILVLGTGKYVRSGGGGTTNLGAIAIAKIGSGGFENPWFESSGSGNSAISYDSDWVRRATLTGGPRVLGISEY
jgi:hypothetical protein